MGKRAQKQWFEVVGEKINSAIESAIL